jgi:hypothetical protein
LCGVCRIEHPTQRTQDAIKLDAAKTVRRSVSNPFELQADAPRRCRIGGSLHRHHLGRLSSHRIASHPPAQPDLARPSLLLVHHHRLCPSVPRISPPPFLLHETAIIHFGPVSVGHKSHRTSEVPSFTMTRQCHCQKSGTVRRFNGCSPNVHFSPVRTKELVPSSRPITSIL